jgi:deazaflavin-dependent oxidoreductase (nitroreductase family)
MALNYAHANAIQRGMRRLVALAPASWLFARILHRIDRPVYKLTRGRHTLASLLTGLPVVMLTTTGARSGVPRTVPVLGLPTPDGLVVIASNWGQAHHPAWHYNLRADPRATVVTNGVTGSVRAVVATNDRRARIWQEGLKVYPGWSQYERRASRRDIAVYVLELAD